MRNRSLPATGASDSSVRFIASLAIAAMALNWPWEMMQMPAYVDMANRSWRDTALVCAVAALADTAAVLVIYATAALVTRRLLWAADAGWGRYIAVGVLGATWALAVERIAKAAGFWSYSRRMPILPVVGVGLWPVLQLALLAPLALRIAAWWKGHRQCH